MKQLIIFLITTALTIITFSVCIVTADSATASVKGIDFPLGNYYETEAVETLTLPTTYEAVICLPSGYTERGGVIIGNYDANKQHPLFNFEIYSGGVPRIYLIVNDSSYTIYDIKFTNVNVCTGKFVHIAITADYSTGTWKCYVDGSLKQTISNPAPTPFEFTSKIRLGGDLRDGNAQYFKGVIQKVALYKDVRTSAEISLDAIRSTFDKDNIFCAYDLSNNNLGDYPEYISSSAGAEISFKGHALWLKNVDEPKNYDYSFAVLGDIQSLTYYHPDKLPVLFDWIKDNAKSKKIEYCIGLGDITDKNTDQEYNLVKQQYAKLDGVVPYSIVRGNHDRETGAESVKFEKHITQAEYADQITGSYDSTMLNTYRIIQIGTVKYLFLSLDFALKNTVLDWANNVIAQNQDCQVIVSTHIYFGATGKYYDIGEGTSLTRYGCENNGQALWDNVLSKHKNIVMLICGHNPTDNIYYRQKDANGGNKVTEILIDPQQTDRDYEGVGLVAMFYFSDNGRNLEIRYYSTVNGYYFKQNNQISMTLDVPLYTVSFDANGGKGSMLDSENIYGEYILPDNEFTATNGKEFDGWSVNGEKKAVGDKIIVTQDTVIAATWKNNHDCDFEFDKKVKATCTEEGYMLYACSICGDNYKQDIIPANGHSYSEQYAIDKTPTCTQDGQISRHCKNCSAVTDIVSVNKNGHTVGKYVTVTPPSCNQKGIANEYCKVCDAFLGEVNIPSAHRYGLWSWYINPEQSSGIKTHSCTICNHAETVMAEALDNKGDLNGDMQINILDFIYMNKVIAQEQAFVSEADINSDNICTADDVVLLKKYILGVWYPMYYNR